MAMDNAADKRAAETAGRKGNHRPGKRSVSGWIREDLVQYAEQIARDEDRSLQSVLQDGLKELKARAQAPTPAPAFPHILIQGQDLAITVQLGTEAKPAPGFAIDFRRGVAVGYLGDGTEKVIRIPERVPEGIATPNHSTTTGTSGSGRA